MDQVYSWQRSTIVLGTVCSQAYAIQNSLSNDGERTGLASDIWATVQNNFG